ncbi:MAG: acyltransferase [Chitinophagales bacterium]|nr:acyltransferase [Chitinophagales bacterium]MDW8273379.1 acyltransferase [Chitinophagales bacterium]
MTQRTENNFDFIRLVAAALVIITHSLALTGRSENDWLSRITTGTLQFSHLGVAIFFVISGYLITQSAINSKTWKGYLWRRILRIFPGLIVVLMFSAFILGSIFSSLPLKDYLTNPKTYLHLASVSLYRLFLFLPGVFETNPNKAVNGSLWTLAYEFTLYIVVLLAWKVGLLRRGSILIVLFLLMYSIRLYLGEKYFIYNYSASWLLGLNITYFFEWSFYFLTGMIFYYYKEKIPLKFSLLIVLIVTYILFAVIRHEYMLRALNYILIPYMVFFLAFQKGKLNQIARNGDFSYGLYIYAFPIQQSIVAILGPQIPFELMLLLSIVCTFPFAYASWHLVEKKCLSLKRLID